MLIIIIFLILVFILYELYFVNTENFQGESKYDYYFNGDLFLKNNSSRINIGVGTEPDPDYFLNVDGTVTINGDLQIGEATLNVKKVIEASALNIQCSKLDAKMINGDLIDVHCSRGIQVGAMYSKEARLVSCQGITLRGLHGNVQVSKLFIPR